MSFFKRKSEAGWLAVGIMDKRIDLIHVVPKAEGLPVVTLCNSYQKEGGSFAFLSRLRRDLKLERYRCVTMLRFSTYQMIQVEPPAVPPEELKEAIRWRVKNMLDYPVTEATIDILDVPPDPNMSTRNRQVFVVCAQNAVLQKVIRIFQTADLNLEAIDIPEISQRNIAVLFEPPGRGVAMLDFGARGGLLTFTYGGELYLSRRLDVTITQLVEADASQREALFERIVLELQRSIDNFEHQFHFISLSKLMLSPRLAEADLGLLSYLEPNLYLPVERIDLEQILDLTQVPELQDPKRQGQYMTLIGTALRPQP